MNDKDFRAFSLVRSKHKHNWWLPLWCYALGNNYFRSWHPPVQRWKWLSSEKKVRVGVRTSKQRRTSILHMKPWCDRGSLACRTVATLADESELPALWRCDENGSIPINEMSSGVYQSMRWALDGEEKPEPLAYCHLNKRDKTTGLETGDKENFLGVSTA